VESTQALIILFDTCEFSSGKYCECNVYIRGGKPYFLNACFLGKAKVNIFTGNNYTAGVSVYMVHSEGLGPDGYFPYVDRPQPGGVTWVTLENIGTNLEQSSV